MSAGSLATCDHCGGMHTIRYDTDGAGRLVELRAPCPKRATSDCVTNLRLEPAAPQPTAESMIAPKNPAKDAVRARIAALAQAEPHLEWQQARTRVADELGGKIGNGYARLWHRLARGEGDSASFPPNAPTTGDEEVASSPARVEAGDYLKVVEENGEWHLRANLRCPSRSEALQMLAGLLEAAT